MTQMRVRTKAAAAVLAVAAAVGVLAVPSGAETVPVVGPAPKVVSLPDAVLRIAVDPGGDRIYLATASSLLVRAADGSAVASIAVPDLADVAATGDEIYLLTRWAPRGGQVIVLDAATLEQKQVRVWNDTDSSWSANRTKPPHLVVSHGQLWWSDERVTWDLLCIASPVSCEPKLWRMVLDGEGATAYPYNYVYSDMVAAGDVIAATSSRLKQMKPTNVYPTPVDTTLTDITDLAVSPDGQTVVAVQPPGRYGATGPSSGLQARTSDLTATGVSYAPSIPASAVDVASTGLVALAGGAIDVFDAGGGTPRVSIPVPGGGSVGPDRIRFSVDGSKLYAVSGTDLLVIDVASPDLGPFADAPSFVTQQYADALGRPATAAEQQAVLASLASGQRPGAVIAPLIQAEAAANPSRAAIIRLYQAAFLRPPDRSGLEFWVRRFDGGTKLTAIAANFAGSPEFQRGYGTLGNAAFVKVIFQNVFGRAVDPSGLAYWTGRLDAGRSRGVALAQWSESSEYVRKMAGLVDVTALYLVMLDRMPTSQEFADAKAALAGGTTLADGADGMLRSPAYAARLAAS
jgi:hypothetical protein